MPRRQMAGGSAVGDSRAAARPVGATNDRDGAATVCAAAGVGGGDERSDARPGTRTAMAYAYSKGFGRPTVRKNCLELIIYICFRI